MYFFLKIKRILKCSDYQCINGVYFCIVMIVDLRGKVLFYMEMLFQLFFCYNFLLFVIIIIIDINL